MKDVVLKDLKENGKKVFTKKKGNSKIKKNCNPLKVNYRLIYKRRDGLCMRETKEGLLKEIVEELNFIERIFFKKKFIAVYKKGIRAGFNWNNTVR